MTGLVAELDLDLIKTGESDDQARALLDVWERNGGFLCDEIVNYTPQLLLLDAEPLDAEQPKMLFVGKNSLATRILGADWAGELSAAVTSLDDTYINLVSQGYRRAVQEHTPIFQYVSTGIDHRGSHLPNVRYRRLVLPFRNMAGQKYLFGYSHDSGTNRPIGDLLPDDKSLQMPNPQGTGIASPNFLVAAPR